MKKQILVLVLLFSMLAPLLFLGTIHAQTPTQITLYAGEISTNQYGFGSSSNSITSPGPTLTLHSGDTVKVTLQNAGTMTHNWALVDSKSSTANVLWNAQIASSSNPVIPGQSASVTFTVGNTGNYYYICQVDGHVALGMWGNVIVESAIPEFPTPLLLIFVAIVATTLAAYIGRLNFRKPIAL